MLENDFQPPPVRVSETGRHGKDAGFFVTQKNIGKSLTFPWEGVYCY